MLPAADAPEEDDPAGAVEGDGGGREGPERPRRLRIQPSPEKVGSGAPSVPTRSRSVLRPSPGSGQS
jgi:hypothetical protein